MKILHAGNNYFYEDGQRINIMEYEIAVPRAVVRVRPFTYSDVIKEMKRNNTFFGLYAVTGEPIEDDPVWIAAIRGGFIWRGALRIIDEWRGLDFSTLV